MPSITYIDEVRRRAVDLYESTPDTTLQAIANDLGISRDALRTWVIKYGTGRIPPFCWEPGRRTTTSEGGTANCEDHAFRGRESCPQG